MLWKPRRAGTRHRDCCFARWGMYPRGGRRWAGNTVSTARKGPPAFLHDKVAGNGIGSGDSGSTGGRVRRPGGLGEPRAGGARHAVPRDTADGRRTEIPFASLGARRDKEKRMMKTILIVDDEPAARYGLRRAQGISVRLPSAVSRGT